nr:hypothetical protein [Phascolarctobacterium succinatutens]
MEDYYVEFVFHSIGHHLVVSVALCYFAPAFSFVGVRVDDDITFVFCIRFAGAQLRVDALFTLHVGREARVDNCSLHRVISF